MIVTAEGYAPVEKDVDIRDEDVTLTLTLTALPQSDSEPEPAKDPDPEPETKAPETKTSETKAPVAAAKSMATRGSTDTSTPWQTLKERIQGAPANTETTVRLDQDVRPGEGEYIGEIEPITISHGQRIILDLNRHTIDWTQGNATIETLFVVESGSSLTITGDGLICGSRSSTNSLNGSIVAVRSGGSFTLQGGSLSNTLCVCAVSVAHNASFTMTGGEIYHYVGQGGFAVFASGGFTMSGGVIRGKDNHYTGVKLDGNAASLTMTGSTIQKFNSGVLVGYNAFTVSGNPQITDNTTNVSLPVGRTITVSGTLADTARIGVTMNATSTIPITSGLSGKGTAANFASNNSAYAIGVDQDSEAVMGPKITVSFEPNGGSGDMADVALAQNSLLTLPECTITAPEHQEFDCWRCNGTVYSEGAAVYPTENCTFTAQWKYKQYTITWLNGDGILLTTDQVVYGQTPAYTGETPTKAETAQYTYTFNNTWSPEIVSVTGPATYTAQFDSTVREYAITFVGEDGAVLQTGQVPYGQTPTFTDTEPQVPGKRFVGWSDGANAYGPNELPTVTGDATYRARYLGDTIDGMDLQLAFQLGGEYSLTSDVVVSTGLIVPSGRTVTLDLKGYTIDRGLTSAAADGYVILVQGTLTVKDSSQGQTGRITGGKTTSGGGVYVDGGTFNLEGGSVTGNTARNGGGVYLSSSSTFTMTDGSVTGNTTSISGFGGGVYVDRGSTFDLSDGSVANNKASNRGGNVYMDGTLNLSGAPVISDGKWQRDDSTTVADNVCLGKYGAIQVTSALTGTTPIGVTMKQGQAPTYGDPVIVAQIAEGPLRARPSRRAASSRTMGTPTKYTATAASFA